MKIDSHHHFWNYAADEYGWIGEGMDVLKKDFGPSDLLANLQDAGIDGAISVQARTSESENDFLLDYAAQHDFIKGVVGYVDLTQANAREKLEAFAAKGEKACGIREVLQGMDDDAYCLRKDFNEGVSLLHDFGLVYDILIFHRHLPNAIKFVDQHPDQVFVLDHVAKPNIHSDKPDDAWAKNMKALGERANVYCKISGMVTEVKPDLDWTADLLKPYFDTAFEAFGSDRLMFGSDWPVCLLRSSYNKWVETVETWTESLSVDEKTKFWGANALAVY